MLGMLNCVNVFPVVYIYIKYLESLKAALAQALAAKKETILHSG